MSRLVCAFFVIVALSAAGIRAGDSDPIKAKLDKFKAAYEKEAIAVEKGIYAGLDKAEASARQRGDKKALDHIKAEREMFELIGQPPKSVPGAATQKATVARKSLEAAYAVAVKEYTKAGRDAEAEAVEKEGEEFKKLAVLRPRYLLIVNKNSGLVLAPEKGELGSGLLQAKNTGADDQLWSLIPTDTADAYLLRNKGSGHYAGVGRSRVAGITITLTRDAGAGNRWVLEREGPYFFFQNSYSKLYAAVGGGSKEIGFRVLQWQKIAKADEQMWSLIAKTPD